MSASTPRVVGILAGGGSLPREIAEHVIAQGGAVHIVALAGEAGEDLSAFPVTRVGWGKFGAMVAALKRAGCRELVIVGSVRRPDLATLRPDWGFLRNLPAIVRIITAGGDDSMLSRGVRLFEAQGFTVVAPATLAPGLVVGTGPLGRIEADPDAAADVALGFRAVRALGPFDVGQAVVVADGRLEAIEGVEGTDGMLARLAARRGARCGAGDKPSGVLVKRPKPGQELRIDLPAIGPDTVRRAVEAGLAGVAVLAGGTLAAEREEIVARADAGGLFVQGFQDSEPASAPRPCQDWHIEGVGRRALTPAQCEDIRKGAALLGALAPLAASRGAVVDRGHVLAVESGEGAADLLQRAAGLRQWGRWRSTRRSGAAVLSLAVDTGVSVLGAAAAGLAGVALASGIEASPGRTGQEPATDILEAASSADRLGLYLAMLRPSAGTSWA